MLLVLSASSRRASISTERFDVSGRYCAADFQREDLADAY